MTWIEGIGDEVTLFFVVTLLTVIGVIAWVSTNITDQPLMRTVLILERRAVPREITESTEVAQSPILESNIDTGQSTEASNTAGEGFVVTPFQSCDSIPGVETAEPVWGSESDVDQIDGEHGQSAIRESEDRSQFNALPRSRICPDAIERCSLRTLRLACLTNETTREEDPVTQPVQSESVVNGSYNLVGNIRIRLKYLNDDQKMVDGHLEEQLGEFKRRHFSPELSDDKMVRLIFNGHVLQSDNDTLKSCGLFDNCVVHCLVHPHHGTTGNQSDGSGGREGNSSSNAASAMEGVLNRDWDMGNILLISLSLLLGVAWYCRFLYGQLFNATTTVALAGLTGILIVSFVGTYMPDQDITQQ